MMRANERRGGRLEFFPFRLKFVEMGGQPFHDPPVVGEDDRRTMRTDELTEPALDGRPGCAGGHWPRPLKGHENLQVERFAVASVDDRHRPRFEPHLRAGAGRDAAAPKVARDLIERPLSGRESHTDETSRVDRLQTLQQQGEEHTSLVGAERVDFINDHVRERPQGLACPTGQHQVERLGRGDQDVGGLADELLPVGRGRVAAPNRDRERGQLRIGSSCRLQDPLERDLEVAIDVLVQGLQR